MSFPIRKIGMLKMPKIAMLSTANNTNLSGLSLFIVGSST